MKKPEGALTREEAEASLVTYRVYKINGAMRSSHANYIYLSYWFEYAIRNRMGFVFNNYFHALAYSLKVKANAKLDNAQDK